MLLIAQLLYQIVKAGAFDANGKKLIYSADDWYKVRNSKHVWVCNLMNMFLLNKLLKLVEKEGDKEEKQFILPGIIPASFDINEAIKDLRSPFSPDTFAVVVFKILYET